MTLEGKDKAEVLLALQLIRDRAIELEAMVTKGGFDRGLLLYRTGMIKLDIKLIEFTISPILFPQP